MTYHSNRYCPNSSNSVHPGQSCKDSGSSDQDVDTVDDLIHGAVDYLDTMTPWSVPNLRNLQECVASRCSSLQFHGADGKDEDLNRSTSAVEVGTADSIAISPGS